MSPAAPSLAPAPHLAPESEAPQGARSPAITDAARADQAAAEPAAGTPAAVEPGAATPAAAEPGAATPAAVEPGDVAPEEQLRPLPLAANPGRRFITWDANLDGGYGWAFRPEQSFFQGRARAGVLFVREPRYLALGMTVVGQQKSALALGLQAEWMHLESGVWAQIEGLMGVDGRPGGTIAVGWSVLGLEGQMRFLDNRWTPTVLAKLRIPISIIAVALGKRR